MALGARLELLHAAARGDGRALGDQEAAAREQRGDVGRLRGDRAQHLGLKKQGKCGEDVLPTGLVGGHVYSVLKLVEAHGQQLVCCRNPWGTGEWKGKWSDKNEFGEWTDEMKTATGYTGLNDGKFWMSIKDFVENAGGVSYARPFGPNWKKVTQYKSFQKAEMTATAKWGYTAAAGDEITFERGATLDIVSLSSGWWYGNKSSEEKKGYFPGNYVRLNNRPIARFDLVTTKAEGVEGKMTAVVMLMQPDATRERKWYVRKQDGMRYKDTRYSTIKLCIVNDEGKVQTKKQGRSRCVWSEMQLDGGKVWKIYAYSVDGLGSKFSLRVYAKGGTATLKEVPGTDIAELHAAIAAS
mmetsp:Transcript_31559/g.100621  ORF Transcript_31559/g.100621 Transcript_31559/m.100621 type:complete len:354 (+) Transcript_31559:2229-3290(+)